jgi:hypothetical protein
VKRSKAGLFHEESVIVTMVDEGFKVTVCDSYLR